MTHLVVLVLKITNHLLLCSSAYLRMNFPTHFICLILISLQIHLFSVYIIFIVTTLIIRYSLFFTPSLKHLSHKTKGTSRLSLHILRLFGFFLFIIFYFFFGNFFFGFVPPFFKYTLNISCQHCRLCELFASL